MINWIPFAKKEPAEGKQYLVTVRYKNKLFVDVDDYFSYGWDDWGDAVVAWAEMPEPYKEEKYEPAD